MAYGGYGVARVEGFVHFVPGSAPGDKVEIEPIRRKKRYGFSRLVRLIEPSALRTEPFCPYFGECGGCQLQHIRYDEQLKIKQEIFVDQMRRIGGVPNLSEPEIFGSETPRIRMRFQVREEKIGLFQKKSHRLCQIRTCGIASPGVNSVLRELQGFPGKRLSGLKGNLTVLSPPDGTLISTTLPADVARDLCAHLGGLIRGCTILNGPKRVVLGASHLAIPVQGLKILSAADAFSQADPEVNDVLVGEICRFMEGTGRVTELYAGCGNITLPLSLVCGQVAAVERDVQAVQGARLSATKAGIRNISFSVGDVSGANFDDAGGLVLDPPREGLPLSLTKKIAHAGVRKIAYVSCNPSTLVRDVRRLLDGGYNLLSVRLLDMFPHTYHIESIALFEFP